MPPILSRNSWRHHHRRRFFHQLLVPPLDAALALAQAHDVAVLVGQYLELDVPRPLDELLHVEVAVAECRRRLRLRRVELVGQLVGAADDAHAAPAAACRRLHDHREADGLRPLQRFVRRLHDAVRSRQNRHAHALHRGARLFLLAHHARYFRRRPNELDAARPAHFREVGVLAQQPIAGMDRIHIGDFGRADHRRNVEVAVGQPRRPNANRFVGKAHVQRVAVGLAINGDGLDAQFLAGANDAQGNLTAVRNQDFLKHEFVVVTKRRGIILSGSVRYLACRVDGFE